MQHLMALQADKFQLGGHNFRFGARKSEQDFVVDAIAVRLQRGGVTGRPTRSSIADKGLLGKRCGVQEPRSAWAAERGEPQRSNGNARREFLSVRSRAWQCALPHIAGEAARFRRNVLYRT